MYFGEIKEKFLSKIGEKMLITLLCTSEFMGASSKSRHSTRTWLFYIKISHSKTQRLGSLSNNHVLIYKIIFFFLAGFNFYISRSLVDF